MEEYHVDCRLLLNLNVMAVFHCIVLSYIFIMIININVRVSLFNTKVNVIANCYVILWCLALSHRHFVGRYCTIHIFNHHALHCIVYCIHPLQLIVDVLTKPTVLHGCMAWKVIDLGFEGSHISVLTLRCDSNQESNPSMHPPLLHVISLLV
jgi:hypothetical protein